LFIEGTMVMGFDLAFFKSTKCRKPGSSIKLASHYFMLRKFSSVSTLRKWNKKSFYSIHFAQAKRVTSKQDPYHNTSQF